MILETYKVSLIIRELKDQCELSEFHLNRSYYNEHIKRLGVYY